MLFSFFPPLGWSRLRGTVAALLSLMVLGLPLPTLALEDLDLPEDIGLPSRRQAGGTRGPCLQNGHQLTPLLPQLNVGRTLSSSPTVFVYIPEHSSEAAMLIVQELDGEKLAESGLTLADLDDRNKDEFLKNEFQSSVALSEESGVLSLPFDRYSELPKLEPGKIYLWAFQLVCNNSFSDYTQGWIQVVSSTADRTNVQGELDRAKSDGDRADIYAKEGLWYDLLATLAQLRQNPSEEGDRALADWKSVLRHPQVGLEKIADQPLLPCCGTSGTSASSFNQ